MLERVPASAESAASLLLRSFERPHRSTRILDPKFWRNGVDELASASWWPVYLQKVRQIPHGSHHVPRDSTSFLLTPSRAGHEDVVQQKVNRHPNNRPARCYTVCAPRRQAQTARRLYDVFDLTEDPDAEEPGRDVATGSVDNQEHLLQTRRTSEDKPAEYGKVNDVAHGEEILWHRRRIQAKHMNQGLGLRHEQPTEADGWSLHSGFASLVPSEGNNYTKDQSVLGLSDNHIQSKRSREEQVVAKVPLDAKHESLFDVMRAKDKVSEIQFDEAWRLLALLDDQEAVAPAVFRFLQRSKHIKQLGRAIDAFKLIPEERRTDNTYKAAMDVELRRYQHRSAIGIALEADARAFDLLPTLLNHFVENLLWNSAAELIHRCQTDGKDYKHLISGCATLPDLFFKVTSLAERLKSQDATLTQNRLTLQRLCRDLIVECARSSSVIGRITQEGVLALLDLGRSFGRNRLHQAILATIFNHPHRAERVDLALFVYRNYRLVMPDDQVSARMLGSLISVCGDAQVEIHIYSFLLREFSLHCTDQETEPAYQRVLTNCARQGQVDAVEQFLQAYTSIYGKPKSLAILSPLIYVRAVSGDHVNARKQFDRLKDEFQLKPNQVCWNMLLLAHTRSNNDLSAFGIFEEMLANEVIPDAHTYGTLLSVCASHADADAAVELLADARGSHVPVTVPMIGSVVEACLSNDEEGQALAFVDAATTSGTHESLTWLWNVLLRYYSRRGDSNAMLQVRKRMADYDIKADDMTYAALIGDLVSRKRTLEAIQMLREMHFQEGLPVTLFHYSIILQGLVMEENRDMSVVIYNEIKQRFPRMSASVDAALLNLQSRRDPFSNSDGRSLHSLNFLSTLLAESSRQTQSLAMLGRTVRSKTPKVIWFQIFENLLMSLIRNGSYDQAELLLKNLESSNWSEGNSGGSDGVASSLLLAKMDLAIACHRGEEVETIWQNLFNDAKYKHQPVKVPRIRTRTSDSQSPDATGEGSGNESVVDAAGNPNNELHRSVQRRWRFSLSSALNRYISSMALRGRLDELWRFIQDDFRPTGFELSGRNWNKLIQVHCGSTNFKHKMAAFKWVEEMLLNRAQSWKLITRGLLRVKQTHHVFKSLGRDKRPVMQKNNSYSATKRERLLRLQPERRVPTYLTFVNLAEVLQQAYERARAGKPGLIRMIRIVAEKTKRFIQQMPYLKDRLQGTILRKLEARPDEKARPRSELAFRKGTDVSGILGSKSLLDHLPADLLHDIEALVAPRNDARELLRRDRATPLSPQQQRDVSVGEQIAGQVDRDPIVLAAKGRLEEPHEKQRRVAFEERQRLRTVAHLRCDLRTRRLFEDSHIGRPAIPIPSARSNTDAPSSDPILAASSLILAQLRDARGRTDTQLTSDPGGAQTQISTTEPAARLGHRLPTGPMERLSVAQQLERLEVHRKAIAERSQSRTSSTTKPEGLAIPYANLRRIRRTLAHKQHKQTRLHILRAGVENFRTHALHTYWHSSRTFEARAVAHERRASVLQQEQDLKAGKRLQPMPKTRQAVRRSRNLNFPSIRFVSDLNRKKWRYPVRRGLRHDQRAKRWTERMEEERTPSVPLTEQKEVDRSTFVPAKEMIKRRHPVLTKIKEMEEARGLLSKFRRRKRRRRPRAVQLEKPTPEVEYNFKPITADT